MYWFYTDVFYFSLNNVVVKIEIINKERGGNYMYILVSYIDRISSQHNTFEQIIFRISLFLVSLGL